MTVFHPLIDLKKVMETHKNLKSIHSLAFFRNVKQRRSIQIKARKHFCGINSDQNFRKFPFFVIKWPEKSIFLMEEKIKWLADQFELTTPVVKYEYKGSGLEFL
jgi:hypothetical protein